jgi:glycosyltransferase involved in cell wall biosynthesis
VGDIDAQSGRVAELLTSRNLHERMSSAARMAAEARFSSRRIIPIYEAYYEEVLSAART